MAKVRNGNVLKMVPVPRSGALSAFEEEIRAIHDLHESDFAIQYQDSAGDTVTLGAADKLMDLVRLKTCFTVALDSQYARNEASREENETLLVMGSQDENEEFQVMLSYSWVHQSVVLRVKAELESRNFSVWMDVEKMHGNINDRMYEGVTKSSVIVPFLSKEYEGSRQCKKELNCADEMEKTILPVRLDMGPFTWSSIICARILYVDLANVSESAWTRTMDRLADFIRNALRTTGSTSKPTSPMLTGTGTGLNSPQNEVKLWLKPEDVEMEEDISELVRKSMPTTREWLMKEADNWIKSTNQVLWITGVAGTGKSVIAAMCRAKFEEEKSLGGWFFCKYSDTKRNTADRVVVTFAFQLAQVFPSVLLALRQIQKDNPELMTATSVPLLFKELIVRPLRSVASSDQRTVVMILDAVDECGVYNSIQRHDLLYIISNWAENPNFVKLLWTSRPDGDILERMKKNVLPTLLNLDESQQKEDLMKYANDFMDQIVDRLYPMSRDEIKALTIKLVENAGSLFVWLFLACEQIRLSFDPANELQLLVKFGSSQQSDAMASIYSLSLQRAYQGLSDSSEIAKQILGVIIAAKVPISDGVIAALLEISVSRVRTILLSLRSLLIISDDQIQILHKSFSDYLTRKESVHFIDEGKVHELMAEKCLKILNKSLKFNLLDLQPNTFHSEILDFNNKLSNIDSHLIYAAAFWILHVKECQVVSHQLLQELQKFSNIQLLHWLEISSVIGHLTVLPQNVANLIDFLEKHKLSDLRNMFLDLRRLAVEFQPAISRNCLQVYSSALTFCPKNTLLYSQYKHCLHMIQPCPILISRNYQSWSECISSKFHDSRHGACNAICWALGNQLVAGCDDGVVRIFDSFGETILQELFGHQGAICSVASANHQEKIVASGSDDGFIIVWDILSGTRQHVLCGHKQSVTSLAFVSNSLLISGSRDQSVFTWDLDADSFHSSQKHNEWVTTVAVSADKEWIASADTSGIIKLWTHSGLSKNLAGHKAAVLSLKFHPGKQILASAGRDFNICLWDLQTGLALEVLIGHMNDVTAIAFSLSGDHLVSCSDDHSVRVWDTSSVDNVQLTSDKKVPNLVKCLSVLNGHSSFMKAVLFSPSADMIVSAASNGEIRSWSMSAISSNQLPTIQVTSFDLSLNAETALSATSDGQLRITELATGSTTNVGVQEKGIHKVYLSDQGNFAFAILKDHSLMAWNIMNGGSAQLQENKVSVLALPSNLSMKPNFQCTTGAEDGILKVLKFGNDLKILELRELVGHNHSVTALLYGHNDSSMLVSGSIDQTIRQAEINILAGEGRIIGRHKKFVYSLALSLANNMIASGSNDYSVRVWDLENGGSRELQGHAQTVNTLIFSPKANFLASGSVDCTLRVWNVEKGECISVTQHRKHITAAEFSADGGMVESWSSDGESFVTKLNTREDGISQFYLASMDPNGW
ncbi:hypothetical protein HDU83_003665, partial [Entophlyctis luteolus]